MLTLNVDESSNKRGSGVGIILEIPNQITLEQAIRFNFETSNNQVEYKTIITRLKLAQEMGVKAMLLIF